MMVGGGGGGRGQGFKGYPCRSNLLKLPGSAVNNLWGTIRKIGSFVYTLFPIITSGKIRTPWAYIRKSHKSVLYLPLTHVYIAHTHTHTHTHAHTRTHTHAHTHARTHTHAHTHTRTHAHTHTHTHTRTHTQFRAGIADL